jgi:hypothetical protein
MLRVKHSTTTNQAQPHIRSHCHHYRQDSPLCYLDGSIVLHEKQTQHLHGNLCPRLEHLIELWTVKRISADLVEQVGDRVVYDLRIHNVCLLDIRMAMLGVNIENRSNLDNNQ